MPSFTFQDLQNECFDRGLAYLNDSGRGLVRVKNWLNTAYREVNSAELWPYLYATTTGAAPLVISDLGTVETVINTATLTKLTPVDRRSLTDVFPLLTTAGAAQFYYIVNGTTITPYPVDASPLTVTYFKEAVDLSANGDTPLIPANYQEILVLMALRRGFLEDADAGDAALLQQEIDRNLVQMRADLLNLQVDQPDYISMTAPHEGW